MKTKNILLLVAGVLNKTLYALDKINDQLYYNATTRTSRIVADDGASYVQFVLSAPAEDLIADSKVNVTISSKGKGDIPSYENLSMVVLKKDQNYFWLWNGQRQIGILYYYVR